MESLTPASPDGLPPLGDLVADDPFWRYPSGTVAGERVAQLRVWLTAGHEPGHLAVVTETGSAASVTASAGHIWVELTRTYGPSLVLLEHYPAGEGGEGVETLDLVRIGAGWQPALAARVADPAGKPPSRVHRVWVKGTKVVQIPLPAVGEAIERATCRRPSLSQPYRKGEITCREFLYRTSVRT